MAPAGRPRRTQAERTAHTRAALLTATLDCLVERGFAATTTTEVTRRAGVSLGALLHHFPTKTDLLSAAVADVLGRRQAEFRAALTGIEPGARTLETAIDVLWSLYSGPTFTAWLELWVAARTDAYLAEAMLEVEAEFHTAATQTARELFAGLDVDDAFVDTAMRFTLAVMDGVALLGQVGPPPDSAPIELLKSLTRDVLAQPTGRTPE